MSTIKKDSGFGVAQIILLISIAILVIFVAWPVLLILFNAFFVDGNFNSAEKLADYRQHDDYRQYDCRHVFCVACYPYGFAVQNLYEEPVPCSVHAAELYRRVGVEDAAVA